MADPLRAMLRVVRGRLTEDGLRELALALLDGTEHAARVAVDLAAAVCAADRVRDTGT